MGTRVFILCVDVCVEMVAQALVRRKHVHRFAFNSNIGAHGAWGTHFIGGWRVHSSVITRNERCRSAALFLQKLCCNPLPVVGARARTTIQRSDTQSISRVSFYQMKTNLDQPIPSSSPACPRRNLFRFRSRWRKLIGLGCEINNWTLARIRQKVK